LRFSAGFVGGGTTSAGEELIKSIQRLSIVHEEEAESPSPSAVSSSSTSTTAAHETQKKRVGLFALFQYSTRNKCMLVIAGIVMAAISGLSMPVWLLLVAQSFKVFNKIGSIIFAGG